MLGDVALRMRQHPGPADVLDVADSAVALLIQFIAPPFEAIIQFVEVRFRLGDVAFKAGDVLALNAAVR